VTAAAERAGKNAEQLVAAIRASDAGAAARWVGADVIFTGNPTTRSADTWTINASPVTVVATKLKGTHNPTAKLSRNSCVAWGKVKSIDVQKKTVTLEDVELLYMEE